jgi:hypothetical protein
MLPSKERQLLDQAVAELRGKIDDAAAGLHEAAAKAQGLVAQRAAVADGGDVVVPSRATLLPHQLRKT